jgi:hypothetical protein
LIVGRGSFFLGSTSRFLLFGLAAEIRRRLGIGLFSAGWWCARQAPKQHSEKNQGLTETTIVGQSRHHNAPFLPHRFRSPSAFPRERSYLALPSADILVRYETLHPVIPMTGLVIVHPDRLSKSENQTTKSPRHEEVIVNCVEDCAILGVIHYKSPRTLFKYQRVARWSAEVAGTPLEQIPVTFAV